MKKRFGFFLVLLMFLFGLGGCTNDSSPMSYPPKVYFANEHKVTLRLESSLLKKLTLSSQNLTTTKSVQTDAVVHWQALFRWDKYPDVPSKLDFYRRGEHKKLKRLTFQQLKDGFQIQVGVLYPHRLWFQNIPSISTLSSFRKLDEHMRLSILTKKNLGAADLVGHLHIGIFFVGKKDETSDLGVYDRDYSTTLQGMKLLKGLKSSRGWVWTQKIPIRLVWSSEGALTVKADVKKHELKQRSFGNPYCQVDERSQSPFANYPMTYKAGVKQYAYISSFQKPTKAIAVDIHSSLPDSLIFPKNKRWMIDPHKSTGYRHPFITTKKLLGKMTVVTVRAGNQTCSFPVWGEGYKR